MSTTFASVTLVVKQTVSDSVFNSLYSFVRANAKRLWGTRQGRRFIELNFILTLYHDIKCIGYKRIINTVSNLPVPLSHVSFAHNAVIIRRCCREWARSKISPGSRSDWTTAARFADRQSESKVFQQILNFQKKSCYPG